MLYYAADPMCAWCWGFAPVLAELRRRWGYPDVRLVMGGLAPDTDQDMPAETRAYVRRAWRAVEGATGVSFNWDFWTRCQPRRSTYPACRAVLAAERQRSGAGRKLFQAIQQAYYQDAQNPSDVEVLVRLARGSGLDESTFEADLASSEVQAALEEDLATCRRLGVSGFPTLLWVQGPKVARLCQGFATADEVELALEEARGT